MRIILPKAAESNEILNAYTKEVVGFIEPSLTADCTVIGNGKVANLPTLEMNLAYVFGEDVEVVKEHRVSINDIVHHLFLGNHVPKCCSDYGQRSFKYSGKTKFEDNTGSVDLTCSNCGAMSHFTTQLVNGRFVFTRV